MAKNDDPPVDRFADSRGSRARALYHAGLRDDAIATAAALVARPPRAGVPQRHRAAFRAIPREGECSARMGPRGLGRGDARGAAARAMAQGELSRDADTADAYDSDRPRNGARVVRGRRAAILAAVRPSVRRRPF